ncbi:uncharacterized protein F4822DRAFT_22125 [Hypoxylon trugodes]|uniref:uncharacterized protein n=1 Tax=Hypoxylon trugodes TaxID=326681 RepID=UPI00218E3B4A|nr:uncharacterized protein F4822DRAFT_22125 [Hypoxylon trugodes]KAI1393718.1 hypothetical protein F4822DRAFT_22125 [Hypoxylon trugodes]
MVSKETYRTILNWIIQQQEYESSHPDPAPLTEVQRKCLEKLELSLPPATPPQPDPELGDDNWVGTLLEYRAARQRVPEGLPGGDFIDKPGPMVGATQRWCCEVRIPEHKGPFPGPDGGLLADGTQPSFAKKKDAKKYAAKCAVQWLRANGYMAGYNSNGVKHAPEHRVTPLSSPTSKRQKISASSPKNTEASTAAPTTQGPDPDVIQILPGNPLPKAIASPFDNEEVSASYEAKRLCTRLGFPNLPEYKVTRDSEMEDFWSGYPDLGMLADRLPEGVGRVEKVLGKKFVKEKIAEELLVHLRKLVDPHNKRSQHFISRLSPELKKQGAPPAPA